MTVKLNVSCTNMVLDFMDTFWRDFRPYNPSPFHHLRLENNESQKSCFYLQLSLGSQLCCSLHGSGRSRRVDEEWQLFWRESRKSAKMSGVSRRSLRPPMKFLQYGGEQHDESF